ncbi:MAG: glucans biosynthesis glucosyltransferase MdoH, partial [Verrucomicrobiia bacterium]
ASLCSRMTAIEAASRPSSTGLAQAVLDPYVNAIHVSLLREKQLNPADAETLARLGWNPQTVRALGEKLLADGPDALKPAEILVVLASADVMIWLHHQAWLRRPEALAPWWQHAILTYAR